MAQCVTFHSGAVVSLGWRSWWCEFSRNKTGQGWTVEVEASSKGTRLDVVVSET